MSSQLGTLARRLRREDTDRACSAAAPRSSGSDEARSVGWAAAGSAGGAGAGLGGGGHPRPPPPALPQGVEQVHGRRGRALAVVLGRADAAVGLHVVDPLPDAVGPYRGEPAQARDLLGALGGWLVDEPPGLVVQ